MKKLVFLHGSGSDENAYGELMCLLASYFDADLVRFNAPFEHPDKPHKYKWFNKLENTDRRDAVIEDYMYSLEYIKKRLKGLNESSENIILVGHSQGGGMAVHIGLDMELACVISINGDLPYNLSYNKLTRAPIYWFESKKDTYIDTKRKESYQLISNNNNFHLIMLENSTHNDFQKDLLKIIHKGVIKF